MKRCAVMICLLVLWPVFTARAIGVPVLTGFEFPVSTNTPAQQSAPEASGTRIVWADQRSGDWDIYMYDLATGIEQPICTAAGDQMWPGIDGNRVVWMDDRSGSWAVYLWDQRTKKERRLSEAPIPSPHTVWETQGPDISGDYVVWADFRTGNLDVFLYTLSKSRLKQLTHDTANQGEQGPRVQGRRVVWRDQRKNPVGDIYLYDIAARKEQVVAEGGGVDRAQPDIWGKRVVWRQQGNGWFDIWYRDLDSKNSRPLAASAEIEDHPHVNSRYVVWSTHKRDSAGNPTYEAIRAYDVRSQAKVPINVTSQFFGWAGPRISDSGIVVFVDFRNGTRSPQTNGDIYGYVLIRPSDLLPTN